MASALEILNAANGAFWANKPTASLYNSSPFSVPNNVNGAITWNSEMDDNWNGHSTSSNTSRYTAQVAGVYRYSGAYTVAASSSGYRLASWSLNGAEFNGNTRVYFSSPSATVISSVPLPSLKIRMAVGDYVEMFVYQNSGGALATADGTFMDVEFVHF